MWRLSKRRLILYFVLLICANTFLFRIFEEIFKWKTSTKYNAIYVNSLNNVGNFMNSALRSIRKPINTNILMSLKGKFLFNDSTTNNAFLLLNGSYNIFASASLYNRLNYQSTAGRFINKYIVRDVYFRKMIEKHDKIINQISDDELMKDFNKYNRKRNLFRKILSVEKDKELLNSLFPNPHESNDRIFEQLLLKLNTTTRKTFLLWEGRKKWRKYLNTNMKSCNIKSCDFIDDKMLLKNADAVIFKTFKQEFLTNLNKRQVIILKNIEKNYIGDKNEKIMAKWSMSYRTDSVISMSFGKFIPFENASNIQQHIQQKFAIQKQSKAVWFSNICNKTDKTFLYVKKLQKYFNIDIYGKCADDACNGIKQKQKCQRNIAMKYKFYLAFENRLCEDCMSRDLFQIAYRSNAVPIVIGSLNKYKHVVPPRSYIHTTMFSSAEDLAEYLHFLDKYDEQFNEYFLWKSFGEIIDTFIQCRMCAMLHLAQHFPMWYKDIWLKGDNRKEETFDLENSKNIVSYGYDRNLLAKKKV